MELYLDTSDVAVVKAPPRVFPLTGVTTDSNVITAGKRPLEVTLLQLHETMGGQGCLSAQVMAIIVEGMMNDTCELRSIIADVMVKVPVAAEGPTTVKMLKVEGVPTLGTAVCGAAQGLSSILASAEHIASYVSRIDAQGGSGIQTVTDLHQLLEIYTPQVRMLAASFKTPRQILDCLLAGGESITPSLDVAQQTISCPAVDAAAARFEQD